MSKPTVYQTLRIRELYSNAEVKFLHRQQPATEEEAGVLIAELERQARDKRNECDYCFEPAGYHLCQEHMEAVPA